MSTPESPRIHAPDFPPDAEWFNVARPLSLRALRGKVVLLDFWTYGCINCMHVIPDLQRLARKYRDELVVIGVHSAKFTNERKSENLRRILVRYGIEHPVVNDGDFRIWRSYGPRAWPTQVLIDPEGYVVGTASGEGNAEAFDQAIAAVVHVFDEQGLIDRQPLPVSLERERIRTQALAFPGKVLADGTTGRLFVADTNHHRVLVCTFDGTVTDVIGGGGIGNAVLEPGLLDGAFDAARFAGPQGMAFDAASGILYIADTLNHAVRAADLNTRVVSTVAGTGRQAGWGAEGGAARERSLNSPWDLALDDSLLFVAMAGSHQLWVIDLVRGLAFPYAGSGREARVDGPADEAAFAQPSGLARVGRELAVADSESNIVRLVSLPPVNEVRTLAGGDLFEFGHRDGRGDDARFQHPLGITASNGHLLVADTYNHRIRTVDPSTGEVRTLAGDGDEGLLDGDLLSARFYEPGGISATGSTVFVADTNNHAVRRIDLRTGRVDTLSIDLPAV